MLVAALAVAVLLCIPLLGLPRGMFGGPIPRRRGASGAPPGQAAGRPPVGPAFIGLFSGLLALATLAVSAAASAGKLAPIGTITVWIALLVPAMAMPMWLSRRHGGWAMARFPLSAIGLSPIVAVGTLASLSDPLIAAHWRCGTNEASLMCIAPIALMIVGFVGAAVTLRVNRPASVATFEWAAFIMVGALGVLAGLSVAALSRPAPEDWVSSLAEIGVLPASAGDDAIACRADLPLTASCIALRCDAVSCRAFMTSPRDASVASVADVFDRDDGPYGDIEPSNVGPIAHPFTLAADRPIVLRRDAVGDVLVLETGARRIAFDLRTGEPTEVTLHGVIAELGPPRGMVLGGVLGLLACLGTLGLALVAKRRLRRVDSGRAGVVGKDGVLVFDDGLFPTRAHTTKALLPGPALSLTPGTELTTYRGGGDEVVVALTGTLAEIRDSISARVALRYSVAIAIAALAATPLAVLASIGLL